MVLTFPNISQSDFDCAIKCLESCKKEHAKKCGFNYPYFSPGGYYGEMWWQLDSSLALSGYKWIDRKFVEKALWNFIESQKEDGRICLFGSDVLPTTVAGGNALKQTEGVSSLPKLFDVAYHILQGSLDDELKIATFNMLKRYLDWWFLNRQDKETGLITSVFEETFIPYLGCAGEYAGVDTNVEVYVGCHYVSLIALELEKNDISNELELKKEQLKQSINTYLWNEEKGAYFPYLIKEKRNHDCLMASTFFPMRLGIADEKKRKRLIALITDSEQFNWINIPLTSVSMKDKAFVVTKGEYQGNASWSGNVWTLINEMVIRGLCDCGENQLAADLAIKTLDAFKNNYAEFINPFDGSGHGVLQYAWTASQYLEIIIEVIFGIKYVANKNTIFISPRLSEELKKSSLSLNDICIDSDVVIDIEINQGTVSCSSSTKSIKFNVEKAI